MASFTQPVERTPAHAVPLPPGALIPLDKIKPSKTNPRKVFEGIEELAASIDELGLLQPLSVRHDKQPGFFELVAGERRLRALKLNKAKEAPCVFSELDDGDAMAAQIVENLQRENVAPLEEAEGFARLQDRDPEKWTAQAIAKKVGKTDRFVQQRIAIARNLAPALKKKFAEGKLNVEAARTLAGVSPTLQAQVPAWAIERGAASIRERILDLVVPIGSAAFDAKLYKGEILEADGGKKYFTDIEQFEKLQRAAAQSVVDKLRAGLWKSAKLVTKNDVSDYAWGDSLERVYAWQPKAKSTGKAKVGAEKLTAIVWIEGDHKIKQATGVVPSGAVPATARGRSSSSGMPNRETAAQRRSRLDFNTRLVVACAEKADTGARVLLTAFIGTHGARTTYDGNATQKMCETFLPPALAAIVKGGGGYGDRAPRVWTIVKAMKLVDVHKAIAGFGALAFIWDSQDGKKPKGLSATLGEILKVKPREIAPPGKAKPAAAVAKKKAARK